MDIGQYNSSATICAPIGLFATTLHYGGANKF